jgi:hypothetical protein
LTRNAVAKLAGIPNSGTVRDIEAGAAAQLLNVQTVALVPGLRLELVEDNAWQATPCVGIARGPAGSLGLLL